MSKKSTCDKPTDSKQYSLITKTSSTKCSTANKQTTVSEKVPANKNGLEPKSSRSPLLIKTASPLSKGHSQQKFDDSLPPVSSRTGSQIDSTCENIYATSTTFLNYLTDNDDKKRRVSRESLMAKEHHTKS